MQFMCLLILDTGDWGIKKKGTVNLVCANSEVWLSEKISIQCSLHSGMLLSSSSFPFPCLLCLFKTNYKGVSLLGCNYSPLM